MNNLFYRIEITPHSEREFSHVGDSDFIYEATFPIAGSLCGVDTLRAVADGESVRLAPGWARHLGGHTIKWKRSLTVRLRNVTDEPQAVNVSVWVYDRKRLEEALTRMYSVPQIVSCLRTAGRATDEDFDPYWEG